MSVFPVPVALMNCCRALRGPRRSEARTGRGNLEDRGPGAEDSLGCTFFLAGQLQTILAPRRTERIDAGLLVRQQYLLSRKSCRWLAWPKEILDRRGIP